MAMAEGSTTAYSGCLLEAFMAINQIVSIQQSHFNPSTYYRKLQNGEHDERVWCYTTATITLGRRLANYN